VTLDYMQGTNSSKPNPSMVALRSKSRSKFSGSVSISILAVISGIALQVFKK